MKESVHVMCEEMKRTMFNVQLKIEKYEKDGTSRSVLASNEMK